MYLKKLELKGFKSFYNKTEINFEKGITSIVGPNGSGKSNVSDSIRWVLGEQSIKSLRGDKLEDVIFAGTDEKKAMSYCEASITIDNSERIIDIDYIEVNIKRRVYRSGESQFFINDKACRLRDIKEMIMDTGIGKEGYSIIEQGKIDEILSGSPINRKKVFEEAAGIAKYRYKKEDGERKLKTTIENLERINDIYFEIEGQVEPLRKQSEKAKRYNELKDELKRNEVNKYIKDVENLKSNIQNVQKDGENLQSEIQALEEEKKKSGQEILSLEFQLENQQQEADRLKAVVFDGKTSFENKGNEINIFEERISNINSNKDSAKKEIEENIAKAKLISSEIENLQSQIGDSNKKLEELKKNKETVFSQARQQKSVLDMESSQIESLKDKIVAIVDDKNKKSIKMSTYMERLENISQRKNAIDEENEINKKNLESNDNEKSKIDSEISLIDSTREEFKGKMLETKSEIKRLIESKRQKEVSLNELNIKISKESSKLNVYTEMERHYEGFNRGVKEVLKNRNLKGVLGVVGSLIRVGQEYENAIEIGLGAALQNVVMEDEYAAKNAISYLKKNSLGRVTFLPLNIIKGRKIDKSKIPQMDGVIGIASDLVENDARFDDIIENLLGRIIIVKNVDVGIELSKKTSYKYKIVTIDGEVFNPGGALTGGTHKNLKSILSRKRIIEEIQTSIEEFKKDVDLKKKEIIDSSDMIESLERQLEICQEDMDTLNLKRSQFTEKKISVEKENESILRSIEKLEVEKKTIEEASLKSKMLIEETEREIRDLESQIASLEASVKDKNSKKEELILSVGEYDKKMNAIEVDLSRVEESARSLVKEEKRLASLKYEMEKTHDEKTISIQNFESEIENIKIQLEECRGERSRLEEEIKINELKSLELEQKRKDLHQKMQCEKEKLEGQNDEFIKKRELLFKIEGKIERYNDSLNDILERVWQDYELSYQEMLELKEDMKTSQREINEIKDKIKSLGNVNLDAIEEYENVKSRYEFYKEQKQDLEGSIESLNELIGSMETSMKIEFKENFQKINANFKDVFKRLFGGGFGELKITDSANILESDIEIVAQPPGKKLKTINLMSGGEKALTAIAILFSILMSKPTPFCILDEIEAPLDDANIYRFGEFLKDLSKGTQFIAITHRRGTMEASDYIYGITMEEKGISKVVGLKLEEAKNYGD